MKQKTIIIQAVIAAAITGALVVLGRWAEPLFDLLANSHEPALISTFFMIAVLLILSFAVFYISEGIKLPSFVIAIFIGMAAHPFLEPIDHHEAVLSAIVGLGATLILFGGGLETAFANFKKLFVKIILLSFIGLVITSLLFSQTILWLNSALGLNITIATAVLLGAVLASTDPAAIIPVLKKLRFKNGLVKDMIISESAVTDVSGTMLTVIFLALITGGTVLSSLGFAYGQTLSLTSLMNLAAQLGFGILFGALGFGILEALQRWKKRHEREYEADSAFFLFIPVIMFTFAIAFGGSGYLAAFIAGLLFNIKEHLHDTERFFNQLIDGFFKPIIFILLGSLVDPAALWEYALIGITAAFVFMLVIRPLAVFTTLGMFMWVGKEKFSFRELLFIACVRETGALPAVLLVTIVSLGLPDITGLVPIGMWVILLTLIVEPVLTPWFAKKLAVAETMQDTEPIEFVMSPLVLLVTRGRTFVDRLPETIQWAKQHQVPNVTVLLCLEDKYTPTAEAEIAALAEAEFAKADPALGYRFISRRGLLEDNIADFANTNHNVSAVFVGQKMLDYRLGTIKKLQVPFYFLD